MSLENPNVSKTHLFSGMFVDCFWNVEASDFCAECEFYGGWDTLSFDLHHAEISSCDARVSCEKPKSQEERSGFRVCLHCGKGTVNMLMLCGQCQQITGSVRKTKGILKKRFPKTALSRSCSPTRFIQCLKFVVRQLSCFSIVYMLPLTHNTHSWR